MHGSRFWFVAFMIASSLAAVAQGFDTPLSKNVVDLGPSPSPHWKARLWLTCYVYPGFVIKQETGDDLKGPRSVVLIEYSKAVPPCTLTPMPGEVRLDEFGGFVGARGRYLFLEAEDGTDGGLQFVVYDLRKRQRIFEDSESLTFSPPFNSRENLSTLHVSGELEDEIKLTYVRVVRTNCDLHREANRCWNDLRAQFGVTEPGPPKCRGYEKISTPYVSALAYPVTVTLPSPAVITPLQGRVDCWPVD